MSLLSSAGSSVFLPLLVHIFQESLIIPFDHGLDDAFEVLFVVFVDDILIFFEDIWLQLQPPGNLVRNDPFPHLQHLLIHFRVVVEELLGLFIVAHALVDVELAEELLQAVEGAGPELLSGHMEHKALLPLLIRAELKPENGGVAFTDYCEDGVAGEDMGLAPDLLLQVEVLEPLDGTHEDIHPRHIVHVVPLLFPVREEDLEGLVVLDEVEGDGVRAALFVAGVELPELLRPRLRRQVARLDRLPREWIHELLLIKIEGACFDVLGEELAGAVT
mmetsp:Transcript_10329/g.10322  ORF Transcript_10329/g.10322 Transcript_10329/m.10322 type:complete len:275 (-) Transcript_10329:1045-1869(-)